MLPEFPILLVLYAHAWRRFPESTLTSSCLLLDIFFSLYICHLSISGGQPRWFTMGVYNRVFDPISSVQFWLVFVGLSPERQPLLCGMDHRPVHHLQISLYQMMYTQACHVRMPGSILFTVSWGTLEVTSASNSSLQEWLYFLWLMNDFHLHSVKVDL
jgi:hypothetical protein